MRDFFKNHKNLSPMEKVEAQKIIKEFITGENEKGEKTKMKILEIPAWIFTGKRCRDMNHMGRCREPVFGSGSKCGFHARFDKNELATYAR